jgi:hypothetical protein
MRSTLQRATAVVASVIAVGGVSLAVAAPAQATPADCERYLKDRGYIVGPRVEDACLAARTGEGSAIKKCILILDELGVTRGHAIDACELAAKKVKP